MAKQNLIKICSLVGIIAIAIIIFIVVISVVRICSIKNNSKKLSLHNEILNLFFIIYVLLLFELLTGTENTLGSGFNIVPFQEIFRYEIGSRMFIYNVLGNILIFVPFGYFVSRYIKASNIWQIVIISIITSATVETVQLKIGRSFDIDDIFLNVICGVVGYFLFIGLDAIIKHLPNFLQKDFFYSLVCIIILIAFLLYVSKICGLGWI